MLGKFCKNHSTGKCACARYALLPLRLGLGVILVLHGWDKLSTWGELNIVGFTGYLTSLNVPLPEVMAWVVSLVEFVGGIAVILGLFTSVAATLIVIEFIFILILTGVGKPLFGALEIDLLVLSLALSLAVSGGGIWSFDSMMRRKTSDQILDNKSNE